MAARLGGRVRTASAPFSSGRPCPGPGHERAPDGDADGLGLTISKRQVVRLLSGPLDRFVAVDQAVLRAGLASAAWINVDDTSARHARADGVTTQIGDASFTTFRTDTSKSRLNFLTLLRAGHGDFVVIDASLA